MTATRTVSATPCGTLPPASPQPQRRAATRGAMQVSVQAVKQGRFPDNAQHAW